MKVKNLFFIVVGIIVLIIVLKLFLFTVDETEQVVLLRLGRPVKVVLGSRSLPYAEPLEEKYKGKDIKVDKKGPGIRFKSPIDEVRRIENRLLEYDDDPKKAPTKGKKFITIDNYTRWSIIDPLKFIETVRTESEAQKKLDDIILPNLRTQIRNNYLYEIVRSTNRKIEISDTQTKRLILIDEVKKGREKIMQEITTQSDSEMRRIGIEVVDVRIKRADLPPDIKANVESRMTSERKQEEERLRSEGDKLRIAMEGTIEKEVNTIVSEAERKAREIEGEADAKAIKIFAEAYSEDPDFFNFLRTLESYKKSLTGKTRFIITTDSDYFRLLKSISGDTIAP